MNNSNDTIKVKIITPTHLFAQISAEIATFPGEEGEFGVMFNHMPMVVSLKAGIVKISAKEQAQFFIFGGIAQVKAEEVNIITEYAVNLKTTNKISVQDKIVSLKNSLFGAEATQKINYEQELQYLNSLINFLN